MSTLPKSTLTKYAKKYALTKEKHFTPWATFLLNEFENIIIWTFLGQSFVEFLTMVKDIFMPHRWSVTKWYSRCFESSKKKRINQTCTYPLFMTFLWVKPPPSACCCLEVTFLLRHNIERKASGPNIIQAMKKKMKTLTKDDFILVFTKLA